MGTSSERERGERERERERGTHTHTRRRRGMTTIIDISGVNNVCQNLLTHDLHGGERIAANQEQYPDQDRDAYVPDASNVAPRRAGWKTKKSNTQMPPLVGKVG